MDNYAYAVLPKGEFVTTVAESLLGLSAAASVASRGQVALASSEARQATLASATVISFGDVSGRNSSVEVGWVIGREGRMPATQRSQMALVSLPAWLDRVTVTVTTGWIGPAGTPRRQNPPVSYDVRLPPDYESLDAFLVQGGGRSQRQPRISEELMDPVLEFSACRDISILIPGYRLWRSAAVTLGGEVADRIEVMPNMRGVIATFSHFKAAQPPEPGDPEGLRLRVWTSEGVDLAQRLVRIKAPKDVRDCAEGAIGQNRVP